ncbi:hypothetical protein AX15_004127 [Amanita polypyramis BW_CC]|nr:hypothetical protein AX15_004127 [Amanita polypyramis BW_CC]
MRTMGHDPQAAAMLAHIVSQLQSNVEFLVSQNYISRGDASQFLAKLPSPGATTNDVQPTPRASSLTPTPAAPVRRSVPPVAPQTPQAVYVRAIWGYNEDNENSGDLSFAKGDIIEIVEETNADWWMGRVKGRQGLFPSSYVEKVTSATPTPATEKPAYRPFGAAYHGMDNPPPPGGGINSLGLQQKDNSQKKSKFGDLGNTMANSAASGVGFGAGAAIGGGLVRAIF